MGRFSHTMQSGVDDAIAAVVVALVFVVVMK